VGQPVAQSDNFSEGDHKCEIQGVWGVGADGFLGHLVSASFSPFNRCKILTLLSYIIDTEFRFVRNCKFLGEYSIVQKVFLPR
jgi:hypothetical protein